MAHTVTRIEGFESGFTTPTIFVGALDGQGGANINFVSSPVRTGNWAFRVNPGSGATSFGNIRNRWTSLGETDTTNLDAYICRFYFRMAVMPTVDSSFYQLRDNASFIRMELFIDPTGVIQLASLLGTTVLALNTWYRIEVKYVNGVGREVRVNGTTEVTDTTTAGGVSETTFGRATVAATAIDQFYDDIVIEADASQANIDWPGEGVVRRMEITGNGTDDSTAWAVTAPPRWANVDGNEDGSASIIESTGLFSIPQTFTVQTADQAGLELAPLACQNTVVSKRRIAASALLRVRLRQGLTVDETGNTDPASAASYSKRLKVYNTDPATALPWTRAGAGTAQPGLQYIASTDHIQCTVVVWQIAEPQPEAAAANPVLEMFQLVTGPLRSTTQYVPEIRTIGITSEAFGKVNEAFNVIAANIRYVPSGLDTWGGYWRFDNRVTVPFNLPANPYRFAYTSTNATSFTYQNSGEEVYAHRVPIDGTGKVFELALSRTGMQPWEVLALDLEITPEGRRAAYLDSGEF